MTCVRFYSTVFKFQFLIRNFPNTYSQILNQAFSNQLPLLNYQTTHLIMNSSESLEIELGLEP